jgi:acetyl/propionyl-CoA carboxylase alpha subunit/acetyl-CoA carboxylase carboxyltransferase component
METEFQRIAIVNRGEAAMRFIHAAREFNHEFGTSLRTIALYTEPDRRAMFVREADEAILLGPAQSLEPRTGELTSSYVHYGRLQDVLQAARAEAVWTGWGFVAEHAEFADLCRSMGIVFIGPGGDAMRRLGDKICAKRLAEQSQVPVVPWSGGPVETLSQAEQVAELLGYPLLIKATAGGGGHGIRQVISPAQLPTAFSGARSDACKAFGDPTVFFEQVVHGGRHVEVQIIADHYGTTWAVGVRDCTIQRRHQKILEEAPSPALSPEADRQVRELAVRLSRAAGYHNAGTVEFLYQPESARFLFMEMNTRLQVEHPVTECTTRLDLVKLQIHVARGGRLQGAPPPCSGHAIEMRLNAEDPHNSFAPSPGLVERFRIPTGPGVRIDTGLAEGDTISAQFDSMIAKIVAHGQTRNEALARLKRVLREAVVIVKGGTTNKAFLLWLLAREEVQNAQVDTGWLDRLAGNGEHLSESYADVALIQAAIEAYDLELAVEQKQFYASAVRGRPQVQREIGRTVALRYRGHSYTITVYRLGPQHYRVDVDGCHIDAHSERLGPFEYWLTMTGRRFTVASIAQELNYRIEVDGVSHRIDRDQGGVVHAPAPAVVVSLAVKAGDIVSAGDRVAVLEAMKMEMEIVAPFSGKVRSVSAIPNVQVDTGAPLLQIDPTAIQQAAPSTERVAFKAALLERSDASDIALINLQDLRQFILGFDVDPAQVGCLLRDYHSACALPANRDDVIRRENEILNIFVDICTLFQREPKLDASNVAEVASAETQLFTYLRSLDTRGEGLPPSFVAALRRTLAYYGVKALDRSPELEQSLLWIYRSHERAEQQATLVQAVLERRLSQIEAFTAKPDETFRALLDQMISVTRGDLPAISDLAQELRYRCFDQPVFERARKQVYDEMERHLAYLNTKPEANERVLLSRTLIECPQPLMGLFSRHFATADPAARQLMLEVLTWRYYRVPGLSQFHSLTLDGQCVVSAEYAEEGRDVHLFATCAAYGRLTEAAQALFPMIQEVPVDHDVAIDFYLWRAAPAGNAEDTQQEVRVLLNQAGFRRPIQRIVVIAGGPEGRQENSGVQHFTYRLRENTYSEKELYRGIHPMIAKRLHLWRLTNFKIQRLPSVEDVYLLHGVARDNPKDERLFAVAEVRDVTPVRDKDGHVVQLPHLERMFAEALGSIRLFQSRRALKDRLYWNRVLLYVWPPLYLNLDEFHQILNRLAPSMGGLGLEQVVVCVRIPHPQSSELRDMFVRISLPGGAGLHVTIRPAVKLHPLKPLSDYEHKVVRMRRRGLIYPYEIIKMLTPAREDTQTAFPPGSFVEHDLSPEGRLVPVNRPYGQNKANIIAGVICNFTSTYPEGMTRIMLLGDPSKDLGAIAEPECRRIIAALDLAERKGVPLEWFPISAGAKISLDSGVENMDWIARVLRRLVEFTQAGGEVNLVVDGINVGAQPYWNAEATMLMHTRGILVMTPNAAMVLTGKRALDYSGSVSAEDNQGIGGYSRIMGLNGQAQYWAPNVHEACHILLRHYDHTYVLPGERFPRPAPTTDPVSRDVGAYPHSTDGENGFARIGEIFSDETNRGRKKSFDIRKVMMATVDQDHPPLERWAGMQGAETAVVWDAHLGGYPICMIGIESKPLARLGFVPADGPDQWTAGTLFPLSSKKVARAINAASNNRPVVLLANLSGFDGSPESMRKLQLEYGAEIGRAVVNFKGPMVFCVISRYHGGAYVVFSRVLNEQLEIAALEGTYASVIGGAPAAAVVFASEVEARTRKDLRLESLNQAMAQAESLEKGRLRAQWKELFKIIHSEKLGEMANEFDRIHNVERALGVGALHHIIPPSHLRPYLIHAVERRMSVEKKEARAA